MVKSCSWGWTPRNECGGRTWIAVYRVLPVSSGGMDFDEDWLTGTEDMCLLYLISITERLNQDPHGMLLSQAFTHGGMSTVRFCGRQEQWKQCPVIPPLPTFPPMSLAQETFPAIQTIAMAEMGCTVSKNWLKHPYFHTGWFTWR